MDVAVVKLAFEASKEVHHIKVVLLKGVCKIFESTNIARQVAKKIKLGVEQLQCPRQLVVVFIYNCKGTRMGVAHKLKRKWIEMKNIEKKWKDEN